MVQINAAMPSSLQSSMRQMATIEIIMFDVADVSHPGAEKANHMP
jgi:hypothetical protein